MTLENTKNLKKQVAPFEKSTIKKSVWQLINTIVPFIILWYLAYKKFVSFLLVNISSSTVSRWIYDKNFHYFFMIAPIIRSLKVDVQIE